MGLAYDRLGQHDKAAAAYHQLVGAPKVWFARVCEDRETVAGARKGEPHGRSSPQAPHTEDQPAALVGKKAIDFNVKDLDGNDLSLEKYRGNVILLDFWAVWCGPCIAEMPNVKQVYEKYKEDNFQIIGISLDDIVGIHWWAT